MNTPRRPALVLLPTLMAATLLTGCATGSNADPAPPDVLSQGGVDARVGTVILDDVYLQGPNGLAAGATAPLRLGLTNEAATDDALLSVSSPVAARAQLQDAGRAVDRIPLPAGRMTNLEYDTGVLVEGIDHPLQPGQWFPVTLRFAHAGTVTVPVTVGPLGDTATTTSPAREGSR